MPRRFAPIKKEVSNQKVPWKHITVADDGSVTVTAIDDFGGKERPMTRPYTIAQLEALVWSGKWEEIPA
jgi:hypothetical protein